MSNQDSAEKFERAGAQAAEVLGRFINIASELGREFNRGNGADSSGPSRERTGEELREVGEQLRRFRESAGYTLDGFANALENQLNSVDVAEKIDAVEKGETELPTQWSRALANLLANCDVESLFREQSGFGASVDTTGKKHQRKIRLMKMFENDIELEDFSDAEFEKLITHMESAYSSAKTLIKG